jgi:hypothetical protein
MHCDMHVLLKRTPKRTLSVFGSSQQCPYFRTELIILLRILKRIDPDPTVNMMSLCWLAWHGCSSLAFLFPAHLCFHCCPVLSQMYRYYIPRLSLFDCRLLDLFYSFITVLSHAAIVCQDIGMLLNSIW